MVTEVPASRYGSGTELAAAVVVAKFVPKIVAMATLFGIVGW
jgi:hypothetical protein